MGTLIISTIASENVSALNALTNQLGRWKIKNNAELIFMAEPLDRHGIACRSKMAMKFKDLAGADNFIAEFHSKAASHEEDVRFEKLNLSRTPMIDALNVSF